MSILRRQTVPDIPRQPEMVPDERVESYEAPIHCEPGFCAEANRVPVDLTPEQEALMDTFDESAAAWKESLSDAKQTARLLHGYYEMAEREVRHDRTRSTSKYERLGGSVTGIHRKDGGSKIDAIGEIRQHTIHTIRHELAPICENTTIEEVLLSSDVSQLKALRAAVETDISNETISGSVPYGVGRFVNVDGEVTAMENPYRMLFQKELIARANLAIAVQSMSEAMTDVLQPKHIVELPLYMQELIALDISAGKNSVVLAYMTKNGITEQSYFEYLQANDLAPQARDISQAIALGAQAMGGCECPLNGVGMCKVAANTIPAVELPKVIQDDMAKKRNGAEQLLVQKLRTFGQTKRISTVWGFSNAVVSRNAPNQPGSGNQRKRKAAATLFSASEFANSLVEVVQPEELAPQLLRVTYKGAQEVAEVDARDQTAFEALLDEILDAKMFHDYLKEYRHQKDLAALLRRGVHHLLTTSSFHVPHKLISPLVPARTYISRLDGQELKTLRLSGQYLGGGGKIGRDTRVIFGHLGEAGVRRIDLLRVDIKEDVVSAYRSPQRLA